MATSVKSWGKVLEPGITKIIEDVLGNTFHIHFDDSDWYALKVSLTWECKHQKYGLGLRIERKIIADEQWNVIETKVKSLAKAARRSMEKQMAMQGWEYGYGSEKPSSLQDVINQEVSILKGG